MKTSLAGDEPTALALFGDQTVGIGTENMSQETIVVFSTNLPEQYRVPDNQYVVPSYYKRLDLSKLINRLLQQQIEADHVDDSPWQHGPFDFLVDGKIFLRTSLQEYMSSHGLTAEVPIQLQYQLAVRRLREQHLPSSRDWIVSLASLPRKKGLFVEASYDGSCRVHHLPAHSIAEADPSNGLLTHLPLSSIMVEISLNQGPLGAAAVFADGAYMPFGCLQVLLGSKGGGYNVVHIWPGQQQQSRDEEQLSTKEFNNIENNSARAAGGGDGGIRIAALMTASCQGAEVTCVDVSNDGVTVASGGADGRIFLWDNVPDMKAAATQQRKWEESKEMHNGDGADYSSVVAAHCDGKDESSPAQGVSVFSTRSKRIREPWKASLQLSPPPICAKEPKLVLEGHTDRVSDLCFPAPPLRCVLYTSSLDETICGWDSLIGGQPLSVWTTSRPVTSITCSPLDGTVICSAHLDGRLRLWDIRSGTVAAAIPSREADQTTGGIGGTHNKDNSSSISRVEAGRSTVQNKQKSPGKKSYGAAQLTLCANTRLDRRFTFGGVPDRRMTTRARWCPVEEGEYWIATVSQDGMLRLRDLRAPSMPLFSVEISGRGLGGHADGEARSTELTEEIGQEEGTRKGSPVRLLSCSWLDARRIVTGGSDGILRVFTVGANALIEHAV